MNENQLRAAVRELDRARRSPARRSLREERDELHRHIEDLEEFYRHHHAFSVEVLLAFSGATTLLGLLVVGAWPSTMSSVAGGIGVAFSCKLWMSVRAHRRMRKSLAKVRASGARKRSCS